MKRKRDASYIENPFIKEENRSWAISEPTSLIRSVSPPPTPSRRKSTQSKSVIAQVEAGEKDVEDHLSFFSSKLSQAIRQKTPKTPRLEHRSWIDLYTTNASNLEGHHFVIHQHDHPVAGTHYDLRLQCNATSSVSWAIMYGLPGDPNSRRLNRNATETRIHCLWNHLIETASHQTGTLLIWDTGVYHVLPYRDSQTQSKDVTTDEDYSETETEFDAAHSGWNSLSEPEKLHRSFQNRRIRLRFHGTRLPENYTLSLWLRKENYRAEQPAAPKTRRRKGAPSHSGPSLPRKSSKNTEYHTDTDGDASTDPESATKTTPSKVRRSVSSLHRHESPPTSPKLRSNSASPNASLHSRSKDTTDADDEQEQIRLTNAYTGATNTINSVHQRKWYLALDRVNSGFVKLKDGKWVARSELRPEADGSTHGPENGIVGSTKQTTTPRGFPRFHVLGREHERSVVTGRLASDVLADEGVVGYVPRGKWRAVIE